MRDRWDARVEAELVHFGFNDLVFNLLAPGILRLSNQNLRAFRGASDRRAERCAPE